MTESKLNLGKKTASLAKEFKEALAKSTFGNWPEGEKFVGAAQAEAIGAVLVPAFHGELKLARISYLFRETISSGGRDAWGQAGKAPPKWRLLASVDFTIEINWSIWKEIGPEQRLALVDHELEHCTTNEETDEWASHPHDLEEFHTIVDRWGLWRPSLEAFALVMKPQLELRLAS